MMSPVWMIQRSHSQLISATNSSPALFSISLPSCSKKCIYALLVKQHFIVTLRASATYGMFKSGRSESYPTDCLHRYYLLPHGEPLWPERVGHQWSTDPGKELNTNGQELLQLCLTKTNDYQESPQMCTTGNSHAEGQCALNLTSYAYSQTFNADLPPLNKIGVGCLGSLERVL